MTKAANDNVPGRVYTLAHDRLVSLLLYDEHTGLFTWRVNKGNVRAGVRAGMKAANGYWRIRIDGTYYPSQRLAWFYVTGTWPTGVIDHIDRDTDNNAFANLRDATVAQNQHNRAEQINNTSGRKGVSFVKKTGRWRVDIKCHGVSNYLGSYATIDEASAIYDAAAIDRHGKFARNSSGRLTANDNEIVSEAA